MTEEKEQMIKQAFDKAFDKNFGKEIIIDGVDVAGCQCFENDKCLWCKKYYENNATPNCKEVKDCYYKQLKQAENTVIECHKYLAELEDKVERLEQENKELLEARNHFMGVNLKYFNALEEIRKKCNWVNECSVTNDNLWEYDEILEIINEVLGDEGN